MIENRQFIVHLPLPDESHGLHIDVLFFGELAIHVGMNQLEWSFHQSMPVSELKKELAMMFDNWYDFPEPIQQAVNRDLVDESMVVNVGDEVAFFPSLFEPNFKL